MADAAGIAAITGGTNVLIAGLAYLSARRQAKTALETNERQATTALETAERQASAQLDAVQHQADVEIKKLEAEAERLRAQYSEEERRRRVDVYQEFLQETALLEQMADGTFKWDPDRYRKLYERSQELSMRIVLYGDTAVADAVYDLFDLYSEINSRQTTFDPNESQQERLYRATRELAEQLSAAKGKLLGAMRRDVTRL